MNDKNAKKPKQSAQSTDKKPKPNNYKPSKYMSKVNKTVLIIFAHAYIRIDQTPPLPVTKCHTERTPFPSLKRDVINEWPLGKLRQEGKFARLSPDLSCDDEISVYLA